MRNSIKWYFIVKINSLLISIRYIYRADFVMSWVRQTGRDNRIKYWNIEGNISNIERKKQKKRDKILVSKTVGKEIYAVKIRNISITCYFCYEATWTDHIAPWWSLARVKMMVAGTAPCSNIAPRESFVICKQFNRIVVFNLEKKNELRNSPTVLVWCRSLWILQEVIYSLKTTGGTLGEHHYPGGKNKHVFGQISIVIKENLLKKQN